MSSKQHISFIQSMHGRLTAISTNCNINKFYLSSEKLTYTANRGKQLLLDLNEANGEQLRPPRDTMIVLSKIPVVIFNEKQTTERWLVKWYDNKDKDRQRFAYSANWKREIGHNSRVR